ncbi:hypothetical protein CSOJ01_13650 [Colletotrichum sojae]|uniref:SnoaL-like domain-containing protein n=1 Tax=Colletotrichum sojae TaxID=2175907 RepID=A0A8H6ISI7_9PEZI|nr:hypothetical protein CSOJ01_13650 [Colletotrichum sojae]
MRSSTIITAALAALATAAPNKWIHVSDVEVDDSAYDCLCEDEAWDIARRWLAIFDQEGLEGGKDELATIVAEDLASYDETFGAPTLSLDELWTAVQPYANPTTEDVSYDVNFLLHTCDQIALNWRYAAVTTGYNSTVPAGTPVSLTGTDILRIDLEDRLITNATSNGDWILQSRTLGNVAAL